MLSASQPRARTLLRPNSTRLRRTLPRRIAPTRLRRKRLRQQEREVRSGRIASACYSTNSEKSASTSLASTLQSKLASASNVRRRGAAHGHHRPRGDLQNREKPLSAGAGTGGVGRALRLGSWEGHRVRLTEKGSLLGAAVGPPTCAGGEGAIVTIPRQTSRNRYHPPRQNHERPRQLFGLNRQSHGQMTRIR